MVEAGRRRRSVVSSLRRMRAHRRGTGRGSQGEATRSTSPVVEFRSDGWIKDHHKYRPPTGGVCCVTKYARVVRRRAWPARATGSPSRFRRIRTGQSGDIPRRREPLYRPEELAEWVRARPKGSSTLAALSLPRKSAGLSKPFSRIHSSSCQISDEQ